MPIKSVVFGPSGFAPSAMIVGDDHIDVGGYAVAPADVTGLGVDQDTEVQNQKGVWVSQVELSWAPVELNADGSACDDLAGYELAWRIHGSGYWSMAGTVDPLLTSAFLSGLPLNTSVDFRIRAVDTSGNASNWAEIDGHVTSHDTVAPNPPSTPAVLSLFGAIRASWDGKDNAGAAQPTDFDHITVHQSTDPAFVPSAANQVDVIGDANGGATLIPASDYGVNHYVRFVAYDTAGNASAASAVSPAVVSRQGVDADFQNVSATKIIAGRLTASVGIDTGKLVIGAMDANGNLLNPTGARLIQDSSGINAYDGTNRNTVHIGSDGSATFIGTVTATAGVIGGWTIGATYLQGTSVLLDASGGAVSVGTGTAIVKMQQGQGIWAGGSDIWGLGGPGAQVKGVAASVPDITWATTGGTLASGQQFSVVVSGIDANGKESAVTTPLVAVVPGAVTTPSTYDSVGPGNPIPGQTSQWIVGTTYYFVITAVGNGESARSTQLSWTPTVADSYPQFTVAVQDKAQRYRVYYSTVSGGPYTTYREFGAYTPGVGAWGTAVMNWYVRTSSTGTVTNAPTTNTSSDITTGSATLNWSNYDHVPTSYNVYMTSQAATPDGWYVRNVTTPTTVIAAVPTANDAFTTAQVLAGWTFNKGIRPPTQDTTAAPFGATTDGRVFIQGTVQGTLKTALAGQRIEIGPLDYYYDNGYMGVPQNDTIMFHTPDNWEVRPATITQFSAASASQWSLDRYWLEIASAVYGSMINTPSAKIRLGSPTRGATNNNSMLKAIADEIHLDANSVRFLGVGDTADYPAVIVDTGSVLPQPVAASYGSGRLNTLQIGGDGTTHLVVGASGQKINALAASGAGAADLYLNTVYQARVWMPDTTGVLDASSRRFMRHYNTNVTIGQDGAGPNANTDSTGTASYTHALGVTPNSVTVVSKDPGAGFGRLTSTSSTGFSVKWFTAAGAALGNGINVTCNFSANG